MGKKLSDNWEKKISTKLKSYHPQWQQEAMWDDIRHQLPKRKKRKPIFVFLWILIPLLLILSVLYSTHEQKIQKSIRSTTPQHKRSLPTHEQRSGLAEDRQTIDRLSAENNKKPEMEAQWTQRLDTIRGGNSNSSLSQIIPDDSTSLVLNPPVDFNPPPLAVLQRALSSRSQLLRPSSINLPHLSSLSSNDSLTSLNALALGDGEIIPPNKIKQQSPFSLEGYLGISKPWRTFAAKQSFSDSYLRRRAALQVTLESLETGVMFGWRFLDHWSVSIGIERQQITELFRWKNLSTRSYTVSSDSAFYYLDVDNKRVYLPDDLTQTENITREIKNYNQHILYHVPFLVGYQQNIGRLGLQAKVGALFNINHTYKGKYLNQEGNVAENNEEGIFRPHLGTSWQASLGLNYRYTPKNTLLLEMYYRTHSQSFTDSDIAGFDKKFRFTGLRLGWQYQF